MPSSLQLLAQLLTKRERLHFLAIVLIALGLALSEAAGVASIIPFLAVITDPQTAQNTPYLSALFSWLDLENTDKLRWVAGTLTISVFTLSALYKIAANYAMTRFIAQRRQTISKRLLQSFTSRPYTFFLQKNPADLTKTVMSEADVTTNSFLRPLVNLLSSTLVVSTLVLLIFLINPRAALTLTFSLAITYWLIYRVLRKRATRAGANRINANRARFRSVQEVFGGIKEIKLLGTESNYLTVFNDSSKRLTSLDSLISILEFVPRYALETVAIALLVMIALLQAPSGGALPSLGAYAVAGFRLLPALQKLYASAVAMKYGETAARQVAQELNGQPRPASSVLPTTSPPASPTLRSGIRLSKIRFAYPNAGKTIFDSLDLEIPAGTIFGLAGPSGSGKSTLVDILLGLLPPDGGSVLIDDQRLSEEWLKSWHTQIGYVPQSIYLADDSIAANIAFCEHRNDIDFERVVSAAKIAQIDETVRELENGYQTMIGDRGIRLSGGQRQRLGIARALYQQPRLLVLDEATNAVDQNTENRIITGVRERHPDQTIILITHRLDGLAPCDNIAQLEAGKIIKVGSFRELWPDHGQMMHS